MQQPAGLALTPEERAQLADIQGRLIELFAVRRAAAAAGNPMRARALQAEIDDLLRQRDQLRVWAPSDA